MALDSHETSTRGSVQHSLQEDEYAFPYHYLDLKDQGSSLWLIEYRALLSRVKSVVLEAGAKRVLDAGCGDGRLVHELATSGVDVLGVDLSVAAIRFAKAFNPGRKFLVADLTASPIATQFDCVVTLETLEHIPPEAINRFISGLVKALRPGGTLIITAPSVNRPLDAKHFQHFDAQSIRDLLNDHVEVCEVQGFLNTSRHRRLFYLLLAGGLILYPLRSRSPIVSRFYGWLFDYFDSWVADGPPEACDRLLAICRRRG